MSGEAGARAAGEDRIAALPFVRRVVRVRVTGSTNDDARRLAAEGAPDGTVVIAAEQTAGRGRLGRSWHSAEGLGLYLSLLLRPREPAGELGRYALAAAVGAAEACRAEGAGPTIISWPNDLLAGERKLGGILAEMRGAPFGAELVVGVGINVNHLPEDFPGDLRGAATSLRQQRPGGGPILVEDAAAAVVAGLANAVETLRGGGWDEIAERFVRYAPGIVGRRVRLADGREGRTRGLHASGALCVATSSGVEIVHSGTSVVPLGG